MGKKKIFAALVLSVIGAVFFSFGYAFGSDLEVNGTVDVDLTGCTSGVHAYNSTYNLIGILAHSNYCGTEIPFLVGVYGSGDYGMFGTGNYTGVYGSGASDGVQGYSDSGNGIHGYTSTGYAGMFDGRVHVNGTLTKSSGSFVQPHPSDPTKELVYAFFEGPEHAVFLRGKGKLVNGKAIIQTPEHFRMIAGDEEILIQLTPRSDKSKGLAATKVGKETIVVKELSKGKGTYEFDYFITAKRAGFERHEPVQANTHFNPDKFTRKEFEGRFSNTDDISIAAMKQLLVSNGVLTPDGKINAATAAKLGWQVKETEMAAGLK